MQPQVVDAGQDNVGGWYTYEFTAKPGIRCGLAGCLQQHDVVYIGKTNEPWRRHFEHLKDKPWIELTSGYRIHDEVYATEQEALDAEERMIRHRQPLANYVHNLDNPHRLVFSKAAVSRQAPRARVARPARQPVVVPRRHETAAWLYSRPTGYVALWLLVAVGLWVTTGHGGWDGAAAGAGGSSGAFVVAWLRSLRPKPRRRRTRRRR